MHSSFQGIVLAGGKSSRFGEDKAQAMIQGTTLLEKALILLKQFRCNPIVVTNEMRDYRFLNCPVTRDIIPGKGPLGGLYTAMLDFKETSLLVLTCDMPALTLDVLEVLTHVHEKERKATVYGLNDNQQLPFPGIYESALVENIRKRLNENRLSMRDFLDLIPEKKTIPADCISDIFININEKKDLENFIRVCDPS